MQRVLSLRKIKHIIRFVEKYIEWNRCFEIKRSSVKWSVRQISRELRAVTYDMTGKNTLYS